jgi:uncharacterized protein YhhL (DUF1145 family)
VYWFVYALWSAYNHGHPYKIGPGWMFLSQAATYTLLIVGGFFTVMHWPQIIIIIVSTLVWGMMLGNEFKPLPSTHNVFMTVIAGVISWTILYCGGFWFQF